MSQHEDLSVALSTAIESIGRCGELIQASGIPNPSAHVKRVGVALAEIVEIAASLREAFPALKDESEAERQPPCNYNRALGDLILQNQTHLADNRPDLAIENIERFLLSDPPGELGDIAKGEERRIRRLFNI